MANPRAPHQRETGRDPRTWGLYLLFLIFASLLLWLTIDALASGAGLKSILVALATRGYFLWMLYRILRRIIDRDVDPDRGAKDGVGKLPDLRKLD